MTNTALRTHPIVIISAIAVTIFSLVGTAAVMGWLPKAHTEEGTAEKAKLVTKQSDEKQLEKTKHAKSHSVKIASSESSPRSIGSAPCYNCGVVHSVNPDPQ